jgi:hypothetical protein
MTGPGALPAQRDCPDLADMSPPVRSFPCESLTALTTTE